MMSVGQRGFEERAVLEKLAATQNVPHLRDRPTGMDAAEVPVVTEPIESPPTGVRYGVLCGLCAIATISYVQRQSLGIAESSIREELDLSKEQMGWVMTAFFATYAVFQIPSGAMIRDWGVRRALPWFSVTFSLFCGLFGGCGGWASLIAVRLGMGVTQAGIFPASTMAVARWFPRVERALPNGAISGFMQVGGALGAMLTGWLIVTIGWRWMYVCYALPGLAWAVWFYWWFRNSPEEHPSVRRHVMTQFPHGSFSPAAVLTNTGEKVPKADEGVVTDVDEVMAINLDSAREINRPPHPNPLPRGGGEG